MDRSTCQSHKTRNIKEILIISAAILIILWAFSNWVEVAVRIWRIVESSESGVAQIVFATDTPTPTHTPSAIDILPHTQMVTETATETASAAPSATWTQTSAATETPNAAATAAAETVAANVTSSFADLATPAPGMPRGRTDSVIPTHTVRSGEILACIAEYYYDNQNYFDELCAYNELGDCHGMNIGDTILLPGSLLVQRKSRRYDIVPHNGRVQPERAVACE